MKRILILFLIQLMLTQHQKVDANKFSIAETQRRGRCHLKYVHSSFKHFFSKKPPKITEAEKVESLNYMISQSNGTDPTFANEMNLRKPKWIHAFALYNGYTYCPSKESLLPLSTSSMKGLVGQLPTGKFHVVDWQKFPAYLGKLRDTDQNDGFFYLALEQESEIISLSWRGSEEMNDFIADVVGDLKGMKDPESQAFSRPTTNPACTLPSDQTDFFYFRGFMLTMHQYALNRMVRSLKDVKALFPNYSIVINGHSLGGAKAMLAATYLSMYHSKTLPLAAVYTYGQPLVGSTKFNEWMARCINPKKVIRVVSANDVVPWGRMAENVKHPSQVIEVFAPNPFQSKWHQCLGPDNSRCSAGIDCSQRSWDHHSRYGGVRIGSLCSTN